MNEPVYPTATSCALWPQGFARRFEEPRFEALARGCTSSLRPLLICLALFPAACTGSSNVDHSVPGLVKTLKDKDPNMRYWAAQSLGHYGPKAREAVPDLIEALKDEEKMVRMGVAYALAEIGPEARQAVPSLQQALKDPDKEVRDGAAYALKQIQRKR